MNKMSKRTRSLGLTVALALSLATLVGCVQYPTEKAAVADIRPQISFSISEGDAHLKSATVYVNGLEIGKAGDFLDGKAAVRVLPGSNVVKVMDGPTRVIEQTVYLGDGVARSIILK